MGKLALKGKSGGKSVYFGPHGTHFKLKGTYEAYNPYRNYHGSHAWKVNKDKKDYTFHTWQTWYVSNIYYNFETDGDVSGGSGFNVRPFLYLMGLDEPPKRELKKTIVELSLLSQVNTDLGIVNHSTLRGRSGQNMRFQSQYIKTVNMEWETFEKAIVAIQDPTTETLPIGTTLHINKDMQKKYESDTTLSSHDKAWLERHEGDYMVIEDNPVEVWMGHLPNRKNADIYPAYQQEVFSWKIPRKRTPPFVEKRTRKTKGRIKVRGGLQYDLHTTLKNNPSALKYRGDVNHSGEADFIHYALKQGYLSIEGRYAGRSELKHLFDTTYSQRYNWKDRLRGGHKFDYNRERPHITALEPSL